MIQLQNISLGYDTKHLLLDNVSTTFTCGTTTALIGRNGTGKSTLMRAIIGSEPLKHGSIFINNADIQQINPQQLSQLVAFVTTERIRIANLSCRDVVALGRAPYTNWIGRMQAEDEAIVMQSLEKVGMASYAFRTMDKMSDGECQRVMIARALAQQTPIILLDEPTSFLDMPNRYALCRLLADLAHEENKCIIFSTHELDIAQSLCDTIALIDSPNMHHLPTSEMISSGHIEKLFQMS
ncbi:MAG: ABC transporter ATP-binding protein [Paludibacteraceae bacterium]|nr:ABC transporter ATP-binding protein [Paludibacteraceae bacterium]